MNKSTLGAPAPEASRPDMPEYGLMAADEGRGLLPWSWARERLERSQNYWVSTVRPDGRPHASAVWGIWWEAAFYFSAGGRSRKARNLAHNPGCVVCTEHAAEAVIVEGIAQLVTDSKILRQASRAYEAKYGSGYPGDSHVYAVRPKVAFGFIEDEAEFTGSATRWRFAGE
jgi:pyridoxine/pyridoxamine 5'-phosphate oxidase